MSPGDFHDIARNHAWAVNLFFCGLYGQWNSWRRNSGEIYWGIELIIVVNLQELFRSWEFEESFRRQYLILSQSNCGMRLVEWWEWREEEEGGDSWLWDEGRGTLGECGRSRMMKEMIMKQKMMVKKMMQWRQHHHQWFSDVMFRKFAWHLGILHDKGKLKHLRDVMFA